MVHETFDLRSEQQKHKYKFFKLSNNSNNSDDDNDDWSRNNNNNNNNSIINAEAVETQNVESSIDGGRFD